MRSAVEFEALSRCWLAMERATSLDELEAATLSGLRSLTGVEIAYTARREAGFWTISTQIGLQGDVAGVSFPEALIPYADVLCAGETICFESPKDMGFQLARTHAELGLRSSFSVPIMRDALCVGALVIGRSVASTFGVRDRALVQLFTLQLSALSGKREILAALETMAESATAIMLRTDPSGWVTWYNRRWYDYTGQTREEAAGWGWQTALHPVDLQRVLEDWPRALETGLPIELEYRLRRFDGAYEWHLCRNERVRDEKGSVIGWCGSVTNIEAQKQALQRTKRVADSLQEAFLPLQLPVRDFVQLDATYVSAETDALVGGDWYDAFELPGGALGFSIGDIAGHGLAASMQVGKLRQTIYMLALRTEDPAEILAEVNRVLVVQEPGLYATAIVGIIDRDGTRIRYASAGHPPPIVAYRSGAAPTVLSTGGLPLGVESVLTLQNHDVTVVKDMTFALYTDGITEFERDAIAAEAKLISVVSNLARNDALRHPARTIFDSLLGGSAPRDDAAILVARFSPSVAGLDAPPDERFSTAHWRFHASDAQAAHAARREIGAYIARTASETQAAYASELIVGELLANTVEHAPGIVDLTIEWTHERAILTVLDRGPGVTTLRNTLPDDILQEGSRGLFLVHALSLGVTVRASPAGGAEIRVILPLERRIDGRREISEVPAS